MAIKRWLDRWDIPNHKCPECCKINKDFYGAKGMNFECPECGNKYILPKLHYGDKLSKPYQEYCDEEPEHKGAQ